MRNSVAFPIAMAFASVLCVSTTACLPAYVPPPGGDPQGGATPPAGTGTNPPNPGPSPTGAADMAMAPGGPPASGDMALAAAGSDMAVQCDPLQSTAGLSSPSGNHNAGQECQGCHAPGGGAPTFYLGGTLYNNVNGSAAVAGATINITDAAGKKVKTISAQNGNFWTTTALTFPIKVNASLCPTTLAMNGSVSGNGACNNCHNSTFRVHLP